jgi:uncharacterized protein
VILVDANLLIYAHDHDSPHHEGARGWLEGVLAGPEPVAISWIVLLAFLRLSTNSRVFRQPLSIARAVEVIEDWLADTRVKLLEPSERHWEVLRKLLAEGQAAGPLVTDAHLAALAIEHGATLASADRDFARFPGLKLLNPLRSLTIVD